MFNGITEPYSVLAIAISCMVFWMTLSFISIYLQLLFCCWSETIQTGCWEFPFRGVCSLLRAGSWTLVLWGLLAACAAGGFALVCETLPALFKPMALPSVHLSSCHKVSHPAFFLCQNISTNSFIQGSSSALFRDMTKTQALRLRALHASLQTVGEQGPHPDSRRSYI